MNIVGRYESYEFRQDGTSLPSIADRHPCGESAPLVLIYELA